MKLLIRIAINGIAIYAAVALLNGKGISMDGTSWVNFFWLALIFGVINTFIKPVVALIGCPLVLLTLGLGTLLINTILFYLLAWIAGLFGIGFTIQTFLGAFLGSLIVSVVSFVLTRVFKDK
jgi:putative membrane protein